jgi:hypothetical protein
VESLAPLPSNLAPPPPPPPPLLLGLRGGRDLEEGKEGGALSRGWGVLGGRTWVVEGVHNGCMGWIHAPSPPLAGPPKLILKLNDFSISFGDFSFFW